MQNQGSADVFWKGPGEPFQFCRPYVLCHNSALLLQQEDRRRWHGDKRVWLGTSETSIEHSGSSQIRPQVAVCCPPPPAPTVAVQTHLLGCGSPFLPPLGDLQVPKPGDVDLSVPCVGQDVLSISRFRPHFQEVLLIAPNTPASSGTLPSFFVPCSPSLVLALTILRCSGHIHLSPHETLSPLRAETHSLGSIGTQHAIWWVVGLLQSC